MKKILIPIEFKNNSDKVIKYAVHLHQNEACAFYLLNTYSLNISGVQALNFLKASKDWFEKPKQKSEKGLVILVDKYSAIYKEHKHQFYALSECESLIRGIHHICWLPYRENLTSCLFWGVKTVVKRLSPLLLLIISSTLTFTLVTYTIV